VANSWGAKPIIVCLYRIVFKEALNKWIPFMSFDKPVLSLSNYERKPLVQSFLKPIRGRESAAADVP
jgi:hypothetical protein